MSAYSRTTIDRNVRRDLCSPMVAFRVCVQASAETRKRYEWSDLRKYVLGSFDWCSRQRWATVVEA